MMTIRDSGTGLLP